MATYNVSFGIKTRSGCGRPTELVGLLSGAISGTGGTTAPEAAQWALTADGSIAPSGTYRAYIAFLKAAGQTYNLTVGTDTVNITMVAGVSHVTTPATDTASANQFKTIMELGYSASANGRLVLGDRVVFRDGSLFDFQTVAVANPINLPSSGYGGGGTITFGGSGYTTGVFAATNVSGSGLGSSAQLYITVSGGSVVHVAIMDPGIGYQVGDVLTVPGGSGFQYTVIDLAAQIYVESETPDLTTLANGNLRRGGSAASTVFVLNAPTIAQYCPVYFRYMDFTCLTTTRSVSYFIYYRNERGYGISMGYCHCEVPDAIPIPSTSASTRIISVMMRLGVLEYNYYYRCRRMCERGGLSIGVYQPPPGSGTVQIPDNTVIRNIVRWNVGTKFNGDGASLAGTKNDVYDNFMFDFEVAPGAHEDGVQHAGYRSYGITVPDVINLNRNIVTRGTGNLLLGEPQPLFISDTNAPTLLADVVMENNIGLSAAPNGLTLGAGLDPQIVRNTCVIPASYPDGVNTGFSATLLIDQGQGGLIDQNVCNAINTNKAGPQVGVNVTPRNNVITNKATYGAYFVNPVYGPFTTRAQVIAAWSPVLNGSAKNADGTYNGALFPDGTWNDGTVYQASPPSFITSNCPASSMNVNQTVTVTFQLDAPANVDCTITPGLSGVTGSFSAATLVILAGASSGTVDFTPTSAGTASITCTNNRSLTNPAALLITVNTPAVDPTAYTQAADRTATTVGAPINLTYVLNAVATADVTLTPAVSGVSGVFSAPTVVIPVGQTTGMVTFYASSVGSGQLTVTDNQGLTDPAAIAITVTLVNVAQMVVLGIQPKRS